MFRFQEITARGGVSNGTLGRVQQAKTGVSIDVVEQLAATYGVQTWQLLAPDLGAKAAPKSATKRDIEAEQIAEIYNWLTDPVDREVVRVMLTQAVLERIPADRSGVDDATPETPPTHKLEKAEKPGKPRA